MNCIRMSVSAVVNVVVVVAAGAVRRTCIAGLSLAAIVLAASAAQATIYVPAVIYSETFDTDATGAANVAAAYPDYILTKAGGNDANVSGGVLELVKPVNDTMSFVTSQTFVDLPLTLSVDLTASGASGGGNDAVGMKVGNVGFVIFPNNGTFRPLNLGAGTVPSQINMGFVAARSFMHHMSIQVDPNGSGADFTVTVTNGANTSQSYTYPTFTMAGYTPGSIGFLNYYSAANVGLFDNLEVIGLVEYIPPAPEPSSALLLGMGALVLVRARRRKAALAL